jgi:hypothetical protein
VVVGVLPGPHANPDYFMDDAIDTFYSSPYQVHYNSNRYGASCMTSFLPEGVCSHSSYRELVLQHAFPSTEHLFQGLSVRRQQADRPRAEFSLAYCQVCARHP